MIWLTIFILAVVAAGVYFFLRRPLRNAQQEAFSLAQKGRFKEVIELLTEPYKEEPTNPYINYYLGLAYSRLREDRKALNHLANVLSIGQFDTEIDELEVRKSYALLSYQVGEHTEAYHELITVHRQYPEDVVVNAHLGFMLIGIGQFDMAEPYLRKVASYKADNVSYLIAYAVCLSQLDNKVEAMRLFERAARLDPGNVQAGLLLAIISIENGSYSRGASGLEEALNKTEDNYVAFALHRLLGFVHYQNKNPDDAVSNLQRAVDICQENKWKEEFWEVSYFLGMVALQYNQLTLAHEMFLNVEVERPDYKDIQFVARFRSDLEDGIARLDKRNSDGFLYEEHMADLVRQFVPSGFLYAMSGLKTGHEINLDSRADSGGRINSMMDSGPGPGAAVENFTLASGDSFHAFCKRVARNLGYKLEKISPADEGADAGAVSLTDGSSAVFQFRQWGENHRISDLYLRQFSEQVKERGAQTGFIVASPAMTEGAAAALNKLKNIRVVNQLYLDQLLRQGS